MKKTSKISIVTLILGVVFFVLSFVLQPNLFEKFTGNLRTAGLFTIFICPILGLIGMITAFKNKKIILALLNIILIFSFPIFMYIGERFACKF